MVERCAVRVVVLLVSEGGGEMDRLSEEDERRGEPSRQGQQGGGRRDTRHLP